MKTPYEMAKFLIENNQYNKQEMIFMLTNYLKFSKITQAEHDELIKMMNNKDDTPVATPKVRKVTRKSK